MRNETHIRYTTEAMLETLRAVSIQLGHTPSRTFWESHPELRPSARNYKMRFGSWNNALKIAGLTPLRENTSRSEILADIALLAANLGRAPTITEYQRFGKYSDPTVYKHVGCWPDVLKELGFQPTSTITREQVLDSLRLVADDLGHSPLVREYNSHPLGFCRDTLYRFFPSIDAALTEAGLEIPPDRKTKKKPHYPETYLLAKLSGIASDIGRSPTVSECTRNGLSVGTLTYRFGSFGKALAAIGLDTCKLNGYAWAGSKKYIASDGHVAHSLPELITDEFLFAHQLYHDIQVKVCPERGWTCDFVVKVQDVTLWLEVDGFVTSRPATSAASLSRKLAYYETHGYRHLVVNPCEANWQDSILHKLKPM